ncbi:hypothetical protein Bbelb_317700 [Branchiostoma belcheri]|nr:hypothetical protein Bbelb_317700 [Branchiostoma belcheri]
MPGQRSRYVCRRGTSVGYALDGSFLFPPTTKEGEIADKRTASSTMEAALKKYLKAIDEDEGETLHSFRAGCAITLAMTGVQGYGPYWVVLRADTSILYETVKGGRSRGYQRLWPQGKQIKQFPTSGCKTEESLSTCGDRHQESDVVKRTNLAKVLRQALPEAVPFTALEAQPHQEQAGVTSAQPLTPQPLSMDVLARPYTSATHT